MALTKEDLEQVGDYVKAHLDEWASERVLGIGERFDDQSRYMNRWFSVMTIMLAMIGAVVTAGTLGW